MNKKKALFTSLAALALASTQAQTFAEEVTETPTEPVVVTEAPQAEAPVEQPAETPSEAPAPAETPAESPVEAQPAEVVEQPAEQSAEEQQEAVVEPQATDAVTTRAVAEEAQQAEVADAPAAASAGEETNTGSVVIPVEYEIRNKPASANRNQFDLLFSVPNSADLDILKSNSGDVYVRFSELASPGGDQIGYAKDVKLEPSADGQRYVGMYEYAPTKDRTDLYFKIFKTKSTIEKSVTISDEQAIVIENGVARLATAGETVQSTPQPETTVPAEEAPKNDTPVIEKPVEEAPVDTPADTSVEETPKTETPAVEETATEPAKEAPAEPVGPLASQANLSYGVSGSTAPVMVDSVKLYDESGNVIYDGARNNAQTVADILAELGLPTDARVTNVGFQASITGSTFVATVILPEGTTPATETTKDVATTRNELLLDLDASNLTDTQKSELAEKIAFAETAEELETLKAEFTALLTPAKSETVKVPVTVKAEKSSAKAPAQTSAKPAATPSRTEKAKSEKGILPSTGEAVSILGVLGAGLSALGVAGLRRRQK